MYDICKMGSTNMVKELLNKSIGFDPDLPSKKHPLHELYTQVKSQKIYKFSVIGSRSGAVAPD